MNDRSMRNVLVGSLLLLLGAAPAVIYKGVPEEAIPIREKLEVLQDVDGLTPQERIDRRDELIKLAGTIESEWKANDPKQYGIMMAITCSALRSRNFGSAEDRARAEAAARDYAFRALQDTQHMSLETEWGLLASISLSDDAKGKPLADQAFADARKQQAGAALAWLKRLDDSIDPAYDVDAPQNKGVVQVNPPKAAGLQRGANPAEIQDPQLRAEYEAAIATNNDIREKNRAQRAAHQLRDTRALPTERLVVESYAQAPANLAEFESLLLKSGIDPARRFRMMGALDSGKQPTEYKLSKTTQPSP